LSDAHVRFFFFFAFLGKTQNAEVQDEEEVAT
jgi:hypothetical protein